MRAVTEPRIGPVKASWLAKGISLPCVRQTGRSASGISGRHPENRPHLNVFPPAPIFREPSQRKERRRG
jgi:hypothetical protein